MDLTPDDDQRELVAAVREFCARLLPPSKVRELRDAAPGWDRDLWRQVGELGVFSLRRPPATGGLGLGLAEAALVFEELGRALMPGPVLSTHLASTHLGLDATAVGVIEVGPAPTLVAHLEQADTVVLVQPDGLRVIAAGDLRALSAQPVARPLDPLTPLHVVLDLPAGELVAGAPIARQWAREAAVLTAAFQVGLAAAVLDLTVQHCLTREQFGRPIGANQVIKHRLADMLVRTTVARAAVLAAAVTGDDPPADAADGDDPDRAASVAKLLADGAAITNSRDAVQLHGGMGFAWETDVHLYLKRAWLNGLCWGTADEHAERLALPLEEQ